MSRESTILAGRRFNEAAFTATCTVGRATGATEPDPVTLEEVPVFAPILTDLPCKIKFPPTQPHVVQIPGQSVVQSDLEWHVPMSTVGVLTNDRVTITAVDLITGDPDLLGKKFRVAGPFVKSYATARRFPVEEVS